jgi:hypothetical protein
MVEDCLVDIDGAERRLEVEKEDKEIRRRAGERRK